MTGYEFKKIMNGISRLESGLNELVMAHEDLKQRNEELRVAGCRDECSGLPGLSALRDCELLSALQRAQCAEEIADQAQAECRKLRAERDQAYKWGCEWQWYAKSTRDWQLDKVYKEAIPPDEPEWKEDE